MAISSPPAAPSRSAPSTFSALADAFIAWWTGTFVTEFNAGITALNLNSTTDTSTSSNAIGTGAKTFTVTAGKSFQPGMWLVIADTSAPSTNQMFGTITSYSGTTLVMNITQVLGSGTKTAWTISQSSAGGIGLAITAGKTITCTQNTSLDEAVAMSAKAPKASPSFTVGIGIGGVAAGTGGVAFPATAVAVADPNTLDDYEEGTWLCGYNSTGTTPSTKNLGNGKYTKIGRLVTVTCTNAGVDMRGSTGSMIFTGLPFAFGGDTVATGALALYSIDIPATANMVVVYLNSGSSPQPLCTVDNDAYVGITDNSTSAGRYSYTLSYETT